MLADDIADALEEGTFAYLGTRTHDNAPQIHRIYGWYLSQDRDALHCYVPGEYDQGLRAAIEDNREAAITISNSATAVSHQLKGRIERAEAPTAEDVARFEAYRDRVFEKMVEMFGPEVIERKAMMGAPAHALTVRIREVFDQTPGPNAGARIVGDAS